MPRSLPFNKPDQWKSLRMDNYRTYAFGQVRGILRACLPAGRDVSSRGETTARKTAVK